MKIIACLGNPGDKYRQNRHNIGFLLGEHICEHAGVPLNRKGFSAVYGTGRMQSHDVLFLFPQTFMNLSGQAVASVLSFYKEDTTSLIVIHDEIELPFGDIRKKNGGGHKGHNGLRSIIQCTGSPEFQRLRFGVGRPEKGDVADYVLSDFSKAERGSFPELFERARVELEGMIVG